MTPLIHAEILKGEGGETAGHNWPNYADYAWTVLMGVVSWSIVIDEFYANTTVNFYAIAIDDFHMHYCNQQMFYALFNCDFSNYTNFLFSFLILSKWIY